MIGVKLISLFIIHFSIPIFVMIFNLFRELL